MITYEWQELVPRKKFKGTVKDVRKAILSTVEALDGVRSWDVETLEQVLRAKATELGWKAGQLFSPIRIAVTGRKAAPPLFDTLVAVGAPLCRARLRTAAELLKGKRLEG